MSAIVTNWMGWVVKSLVVCVALMAIQTTARADNPVEGVAHSFFFGTGPFAENNRPKVLWRIYWDVKFDSRGTPILGTPSVVHPAWVAARRCYQANVSHTYPMGSGGTCPKIFLIQEETWTTTNHAGTKTTINKRVYTFGTTVLRNMTINQ